MQWLKSKITRWTSGDYRITEGDTQTSGRPFRLDLPFPEEPEFYTTLDDAKAVADLKNLLAVTQEDNQRLRAELDAKNGVWPRGHQETDLDLSDGLLADAQAAEEEAKKAEHDAMIFAKYGHVEEDGRGVPA